MNSLIKVTLLFVCFCGCLSETFTGNPATDIPTQQALSNQYSNLILEFQSITAFSNAVRLWQHKLHSDNAVEPQSFLEEDVDSDNDFVLEEEKSNKPQKGREFEMWGPMMGMGAMGGYYGAATPKFESKLESSRSVEAQMEYAFMSYLKYLGLITARKIEIAQNTHYQSRAITSALQTIGAANPMASSLLYMLYFRDVIQTLMTSQSIQRHDSWTFWNIIEILETNEDPDKTKGGEELGKVIDRAYATAMRVYSTEAMYDFQTYMIDYYLSPMLAQIAGAAAQPAPAPATPASFLEEESTAQPGKPFFPFMMSSPQSMVYYIMMMKFYTKYLLYNAAQTLAVEANYRLHPADQSNQEHLAVMRRNGVNTLAQWCQMKYFLVYMDLYMLYVSPLAPLQGFDGPAHAASVLVQTDSQAAPRPENPVIEAVAAPQQPQQVQPQQEQRVLSVVG